MAVVVVNYGSHALLERNFRSLTTAGAVLVVDNHTTEDERRRVAALCRANGWSFLPQTGNTGFGAGVNAGVRALWDTGIDTFLFVNPDCVLSAAVADELVRTVRADPDSIVSPALVDVEGRVTFRGSVVSLRAGEIRAVDSPRPWRHEPSDDEPAVSWLPGTCLAMHRDLLARLGGFDEQYFLYWEDVDLSLRCLRAGGRLVVRSDLQVEHDSGGTQGPQRGRAKSAVYYRYNCRNRLLFAARHLSRRDAARFVRTAGPVGWDILLRGGRRQLLTSPAGLFAALRGTVEGIGLVLAARRTGRRNDHIAWFGASTHGAERR